MDCRNNVIAIAFSLDLTPQENPLLIPLSKLMKMEYLILYREASRYHLYLYLIYIMAYGVPLNVELSFWKREINFSF